MLRFLVASALLGLTHSWMVVTPVVDNTIQMLTLNDNGTKGKDVVTIPVDAGEKVEGNSFACGRCFCLLMTTTVHQSFLYNISFCLTEKPAVESKLTIRGKAHNLHSAMGEGDGGAGYTILVDSANNVIVTKVDGLKVTPLVDISEYVNGVGSVYPGGSAFCADTLTMWVAVQSTASPSRDTLITMDLKTRSIVANITLAHKTLTAHFSKCGDVQEVGGITQVVNADGVPEVQIGLLSVTGQFSVFDKMALPKGSKYTLSPVVEGVIMPQWFKSYGAALYVGDHFALPGLLFVSNGGGADAPPATIAKLKVAVIGIAEAY